MQCTTTLKHQFKSCTQANRHKLAHSLTNVCVQSEAKKAKRKENSYFHSSLPACHMTFRRLQGTFSLEFQHFPEINANLSTLHLKGHTYFCFHFLKCQCQQGQWMSQEIMMCPTVTVELKWLISKLWLIEPVEVLLKHQTKSETWWKPPTPPRGTLHRGHPHPQHARLTSPHLTRLRALNGFRCDWI